MLKGFHRLGLEDWRSLDRINGVLECCKKLVKITKSTKKKNPIFLVFKHQRNDLDVTNIQI